jgi:hypothetical protein
MYTPEMDPTKGPVKLTQNQVAVQKAAAHMLKVPPRSQSPVGGSSDDDDPTGSEWIWSHTKGCMRKNKYFEQKAATEDSKAKTMPPGSNPSIPRPSTQTGSAPLAPTVNVPLDTIPDLTKGKRRGVSTVKNGAGKKAAVATPVARPADPELTQPISTRAKSKDASRAGSLRPGVGCSGQKDTCAASSNPSKT